MFDFSQYLEVSVGEKRKKRRRRRREKSPQFKLRFAGGGGTHVVDLKWAAAVDILVHNLGRGSHGIL